MPIRLSAALLAACLLANPASAQTVVPALRIGQLPKPADALQKRMAFDAFSTYRCSDCEGGKGYDSWGRHYLGLTAQYAWEDKIGGLKVGEALSWKGREAVGGVKVVSANPVGGYQCKQLLYTMTKGGQTATRDGQFCLSIPKTSDIPARWTEHY